MEFTRTTPTGVKLTLIQGFKGQVNTTNLEALRDRCYSLNYSLKSLRDSIQDQLTLKQLVKFQATFSKDTDARCKSLPKRLQAAYLETERLRLELVAAQDEFKALRDAESNEVSNG